MNTFEESFFERVERWVHVYGLPYHLWCNENFASTRNEIGEAVIVDPCSINFTKLDVVRIQVRTEKSAYSFESIWVSGGIKKCRLGMFPFVSADEVKMGWTHLDA